MNADKRGLKHKELTEAIIGVFFGVYNELGHGRATEIEVGLLFNFGIKPEFKRLAYDNSRKRVRQIGEISIAALLKPDD